MDDEGAPDRPALRPALVGLAIVGVFVLIVSRGSFCIAFTVVLVAAGGVFAHLSREKERAEAARRLRLAAAPAPEIRGADATTAGTRWPLEKQYRLTVVELAAPGGRADPGKRAAAVLRVQDSRIIVVAADAGGWEPPAVIASADIERIELTSASAVLVGRGAAYALVPASYADRERLEWELAVRFPDAVERGLPSQ